MSTSSSSSRSWKTASRSGSDSGALSETSQRRLTSSSWTRGAPLSAQRCRGRWSITRCATVASLLTPDQIEVAESFARLAAIDLAAAEKLAPDPEMDDRPVGFHAQQAVEKAVKVVLMLKGI